MTQVHLIFYICLLLWGYCSQNPAQRSINKNRDSLYTEQYITSIYINEPERALKLLEKAETDKLLPLHIIDDLRSMAYRNMYMCKLAFIYAQKSYANDSTQQNNPQHLLKMTVTLAELANLLSNYEESTEFAIKGIKLAQENKNKKAEAKLLFCIGENERMLALTQESYERFDQAIQLLQKGQDIEEMAMLSYFYGVKMSYLIDDSRFEEAIFIGLERQKLINKMNNSPELPPGYADLQYAYVYSKLAYALFMTGEYTQAENYFRKYLLTHSASTPSGKYDAVPYLLLTKQYQSALDKSYDLKNILVQQDTLNQQYIGILQNQIKAYTGLKDYQKVAELQTRIMAISDSLFIREKKNAALELNIIYKTNQKEAQIAKHISQLKIRTILLVSLTSISILLLLLLWRIWKYNRTIKYKNATLLQYINEELSNQNKLQETYKSLHLLNEKEETIYPQNDSNTHNEEQEQIENKAIFEKLNFTITQDKLYLSPDLSREELAKKVHLNNTRFARMIKENTGTNLNGYLNNLRLKYAIQLLKEQPNYTLKAIAEESGINSMPTFHNLFKVKTGMTPSEFKNALKSKKVD